MRTELVFILDRSGSMCGLERDTIGGFNAMLTKQQGQSGGCTVTTVLFDDQYQLLHDRIPLAGVPPMTERDYYVRGCIALLDAIGKTVTKIAAVQRATAPEYRADKVVCVITTDGMENASREYTPRQVKALVERQQKEFGWEFLFLGANIDAVGVAEGFGIPRSRAAEYHADGEGTRLNYEVVGQTLENLRAGTMMEEDCLEPIRADHARRKR